MLHAAAGGKKKRFERAKNSGKKKARQGSIKQLSALYSEKNPECLIVSTNVNRGHWKEGYEWRQKEKN